MLDSIIFFAKGAYLLGMGLLILCGALNWVALFLRPEYYQPGMEFTLIWVICLLLVGVSFSPLQRKH